MASIAQQNTDKVAKLHPDPEVQQAWIKLFTWTAANGISLLIYSGLRDYAHQSRLYSKYISGESSIPAAEPGKSYHNYGLAVDVSVQTPGVQDPRDLVTLKRVAAYAKTIGIEWGGDFKSAKYKNFVERHHFQYTKGYTWQTLKKLKDEGKVDAKGYVILQPGDLRDKNSQTSQSDGTNDIITTDITIDYGSDIDEKFENVSSETTTTPTTNQKTDIKVAKDIVERPAVGIWQIIKLIIDEEVAGKAINDMTIAFNQGSLLNFVNKVCQQPWVEFFSDTYGDKFYFIVRKPPFTFSSWQSLITMTIKEQDVISDSLSWYDGEVYSWYQLLPQGTYITEVDDLYQFMPAMYFSEYAEVWGSKPLIAVSNYVEYSNVANGEVVLQHEYEELKFLIQTNNYLPFTRQGTIVVNGDRKYKIGMKIYYMPTGEEFYIDSVNQNYSMSNVGPERTTTLQVSRGMVRKYINTEIKDDKSLNYFNLMTFGDYEDVPAEVDEVTNANVNYNFYYDNDVATLTNPLNNLTDAKTLKLDLTNPGWRAGKQTTNTLNLAEVADKLHELPSLELMITGYIDSDLSVNNSKLPLKRAEHLKHLITSLYKLAFPEDATGIASLDSRLHTEGATLIPPDDKSPLSLALNRKVKLVSLDMVIKKPAPKQSNNRSLNWRVNREVFQFFLNRLQFPNTNGDKI